MLPEKSTRNLLPQMVAIYPEASAMRLNLQSVAKFKARLAAKLLTVERIEGVSKSPGFSHSGCHVPEGFMFIPALGEHDDRFLRL